VRIMSSTDGGRGAVACDIWRKSMREAARTPLQMLWLLCRKVRCRRSLAALAVGKGSAIDALRM